MWQRTREYMEVMVGIYCDIKSVKEEGKALEVFKRQQRYIHNGWTLAYCKCDVIVVVTLESSFLYQGGRYFVWNHTRGTAYGCGGQIFSGLEDFSILP